MSLAALLPPPSLPAPLPLSATHASEADLGRRAEAPPDVAGLGRGRRLRHQRPVLAGPVEQLGERRHPHHVHAAEERRRLLIGARGRVDSSRFAHEKRRIGNQKAQKRVCLFVC